VRTAVLVFYQKVNDAFELREERLGHRRCWHDRRSRPLRQQGPPRHPDDASRSRDASANSGERLVPADHGNLASADSAAPLCRKRQPRGLSW
jgi:hypothetical protein